MNNFIKGLKLLILGCLFFLSQKSYSQGDFFVGLSATVLTDVSKIKSNQTPLGNLDKSNPEYVISYATMGTVLRLTIFEPNTESAFAVSFDPSLGLSISGEEVLTFRAPVYFEYGLGNIATMSSKKNWGFGLGFGLEYNHPGMFGDAPADSPFPYLKHRDGFNPSAKLAVRFWDNNSIGTEIGLRYGFPRRLHTDPGDNFPENYEQTISSLQIVLTRYFNY